MCPAPIPTPPTTTIKTYSLTGSNSKPILSNAKQFLKPLLPTSIPLYRRLQFGRFFDATCLLSNLPLDTTNPIDITQDHSPWLIAFVDRSCRPETEVWMSASWESAGESEQEEQSIIDELVRNLMLSMKNLTLPTSIHQDPSSSTQTENDTLGPDHSGLSRQDYGGHASDPNIMLFGAVHAQTVEIFKRAGVLSFRFKSVLVPNSNFIWDVETLPPPKHLPEGLRWGELQREHFEIVRARTQIPRQDHTLAALRNLGIFPTATTPDQINNPIAWAFIGLDASLTTLHVEEPYRGRGLAKTLTTKLFKDEEKMKVFWEEGEPRLAHGYVIEGNRESEGMCRSLGGRSGWQVYWLRVDLGLV